MSDTNVRVLIEVMFPLLLSMYCKFVVLFKKKNLPSSLFVLFLHVCVSSGGQFQKKFALDDHSCLNQGIDDTSDVSSYGNH